MTRRRRRFGPITYATVAVAAIALGSVPTWGIIGDRWQAWEYARHLHDPLPAGRAEGITGLVRLGPPAFGWMLEATADPDPVVRRLACANLARTDPDQAARVVDALATAASDPDPGVRWEAIGQIGDLGGGFLTRAGTEATGRAIAALGTALGDPIAPVRRDAAVAIVVLGPPARPAVAALDRALSGPDKELRVYAAWALLRVDRPGARERAVAALTRLLADPAVGLERWRLVENLRGEIGAAGLAAALIPLLRHDDPGVRAMAMDDLIGSCAAVPATLPVVLAALDCADAWLRCRAALFLLLREEAVASRALGVLVEQMIAPRDGGMTIEDIVKQLREQAPGEIVPAVASIINFPDRGAEDRFGYNTIHALQVIGPADAVAAVPLLRELAGSPVRAIGVRAVEALAEISPSAAVASIPLLLECTRPGPDVGVRLTALDALGKLGPAATAAVPTLLELADEEQVEIAAGAIAALGRIDPARAAGLKRAILGQR